MSIEESTVTTGLSLLFEYSAKSYALYSVVNDKLSTEHSTLPDANDAELKRFLETRLTKGVVLLENGHVTPIDLGIEPALCYYRLLETTGSTQLRYVLCFITESNRGLDSFRCQLDQHAAKIGTVLSKSPEKQTELKSLMENWYFECLLFICRCVKKLGKDIKYVIYNAVANGQMKIDSDDKLLEADLEKFHSSCTLAALLNYTDYESDISGSLVDLQCEPVKTKLDVDILGVTINAGTLSFSGTECTVFCEEWAQHILEKYAYSLAEGGDVNPHDLKQVNENYKLKTIQDMNSLKRLVKQAELDYYGLFRAYTFLNKSGNFPILLMHAINEENNADSLSILNLMRKRIGRLEKLKTQDTDVWMSSSLMS